MSTSDDQNVERGQVVPPWKRGEKTSSTGLTAGEMAKAAGVDSGSRPAAGPAPRGVVSSTPPAGSGSTGSGSTGPNPSATAGSSASSAPQGPVQGPPQAPVQGPAQSSSPSSQSPTTKSPAAPAPAGSAPSSPSAPPQPGSNSGPSGPTEAKKFAESDTRNIPRNELAKRDELPDLDAIHHVEASKEAKAAARAQSQTIPSRSIGTPLRAAVQIRRVDPWSVFKVTGVLAVVGFFIWMIAVAVLYGVLGGMGVWEQINSSFGNLVEGEGQSNGDLIGTGMVFGFSAVFGVIAGILVTGLSTISAYIYNVCADMVGGVEVTLADLD